MGKLQSNAAMPMCLNVFNKYLSKTKRLNGDFKLTFDNGIPAF